MAWGDKRRERKDARRNAKLDRVQARQDGKTSRTSAKQKAKEAAYAAGIDPGAKWTDLAGKGLDFAGDVLGGGGAGKKQDPPPSTGGLDPMVLAAIAAGALLFLKK